MSLTFTITPNGGSAIEFKDISLLPDKRSDTTGATKCRRGALGMSVGAPSKDLNVWHAPGTDGNVVCDLGYAGQTIACTAIYAGVYNDALRAYENDKYLMSQTHNVIVDHAGWTHNRCRLKDARESMPPRGYQCNYVMFTVIFIFDQHGKQAQGPTGAVG